MDFKNISLIGFMGSGKSTVGEILAGKLRFIFIDLDRIIELSEEREIRDIFKRDGEKYFRESETKVTRKIYKNKKCVFACGGGIVKRKENMHIIKNNSIVIYLNITARSALDRLRDDKNRPLIDVENKKEVIEKMIKERDILYRKYADIVVNNDKNDPEQTSNEIITRLKVQK